MEIFIEAVLAAAWMQSVMKLTLLPRTVRWGILAMAVFPAFLCKTTLMRFNLHSIDRFLSSAGNLKDFCALVVEQELLALLAGLSLLKERELGEKVHRWKYLALLPSLLLPFVVMYLTVVGFNRLVRYEFDTLLWWSAGGFVLVSALSCEVWGLVHPTERRRVSAALAGSWMLVLLAVFLPAAAGGELSQGGGAAGSEPVRDFAILGILTLVVALSALAFQICRKRKEQIKKCVTSQKS